MTLSVKVTVEEGVITVEGPRDAVGWFVAAFDYAPIGGTVKVTPRTGFKFTDEVPQ